MTLLLAAALILHDGRVFIGPGRYASAVAVDGGRIVKVGDDVSVLELKTSETKVVDLDGRAVTPAVRRFEAADLRAADADQLESLVKKARLRGQTPLLRASTDGEALRALDVCAPRTRKPLPNCVVELGELSESFDLKRFRYGGVAVSADASAPLRELHRAGVTLALRPDVPLAAAVERGLTLEWAVSHLTLGAAKAFGKERELGTIEAGKLAELAVWDRDIFKDPSKLSEARAERVAQ